MVRTGPTTPTLCAYLMSPRDAWAKHKDLDQFEARWLYVDALLKVCTAFMCVCLPRSNLIDLGTS